MTAPVEDGRTRLRRPDWLPLPVGLVAMVVYLAHGWDGELTRDLGIYSYAGQRVLDGVPPYVGVMNRAGPLAQLLPALGAGPARLLGVDDLVGMRMLYLGFAALAVVVAYVVGRDAFSSRAAGLVAAATLLSFAGFVELASNGPREKTPMVLLMLLALWAMVRRRWLLAGVAAGLATLVLQIAFFVVVPALGVAALLQPAGRRLRALAGVALGGVLTLAVTVLGFAAAGALQPFVRGFLTINATYTTAKTPDVAHIREKLVLGYGPTLWILVVGLVAVTLLAVPALAARRRNGAIGVAVPALGLAAVTGVLWTVRDFDSWPDAFPLLPVAALGVAALFAAATVRAPRTLSVLLAVALVAAGTGLAAAYSVSDRSQVLVAQRAEVAAVLGELPADATVVSIQAPQPLVLAHKTNPFQFQMFASGFDDYVADVWPGGLEGFAAAIERREPDLVAVGKPKEGRWIRMLRPRYRKLGCAPGWVWLADASLGQRTLQKLRHTVEEHHSHTDPQECTATRQP